MRLHYKITIIVLIFGVVILTSISLIYTTLNNNNITKSHQDMLIKNAVDLAHHIEHTLLDKIHITQTLSSAPIVLESLIKSNDHYEKFSEAEKKEYISELNEKWKKTEDIDNPFIVAYLNNRLANYLKNQQSVMPGMYGEIFITNRYGALVAGTGKLSTLAHAHKYWWKESYNSGKGKVFLDDRNFDESVNGYMIGVVVPIRQNGEIIGILKSNINIIDALDDMIKHYSSNYHGDLKIVRSKGLVVLEDGSPTLSTKINPKLVESLKNLEIGSKLIEDNGRTNFISYAPVRLTIDEPGIGFGSKAESGNHSNPNNSEIWHTVVTYDNSKAMLLNRQTEDLIIYIGFIFIVFSALLSYLIGRWISKPIDELSEVAKRIGKGEHELRVEINSKDEVGTLAKSFNNMLDELEKTMTSLTQEIEKRKEAETQLLEKEKMLIIQSRHAAIGEMISMIAHQWRQPISVISMDANNIMVDITLDNLSIESLKEDANDIILQTQHLSQTIDDFRSFFKSTRHKDETLISDIFMKTYKIIDKSLSNNNIAVENIFDSNTKISVFSKELMQVLINLLNNAKDALLENREENRKIINKIYETDSDIIIEIYNNGGSISDDILEKIFEAYFSTKNKKNGTGLGLYMCKTIIESHLNGKIYVKNSTDAVCFIIELPKDDVKDG